MFVARYVKTILMGAISTWSRGMALILALLPAIAAIVYRLVPGLPHNWDDPALIAAALWFVLLVLVIVPARVFDEQQRKIRGAEALPGSGPVSGMFTGATIEHLTQHLYLSDATGYPRSLNGSNTVIRGSRYEAVVFRSGTVFANAGAAVATGEAHDATVQVEPSDTSD